MMNSRIRVFLLLALLLIGATSLLASPQYEIYIEYYTDATYTDLCGERYILCSGFYSWGCRTAYYLSYQGMEC